MLDQQSILISYHYKSISEKRRQNILENRFTLLYELILSFYILYNIRNKSVDPIALSPQEKVLSNVYTRCSQQFLNLEFEWNRIKSIFFNIYNESFKIQING